MLVPIVKGDTMFKLSELGGDKFVTLKKHIRWFMFRMKDDRLDSTAAHAAYFLIISFIPFIAFLMILFNQLHISQTELVQEILTLIPENIIDFISPYFNATGNETGIFSISVIAFIWSASNGMVAIIKGYDKIYDIEETRSYIHLRLVAMVYILLLAVVLIITAVTLVFGSTIYNFLLAHAGTVIASVLQYLRSGLGFVFLILFFCIIFNVIPRRKVHFINNLIGAIFSALGWIVFSYFFSIFAQHSTNFSVVYGSLAALIVIMFWLYSCMYIMFMGAEVAMWLEHSGVKQDIASSLRHRKKPKPVLKPVITPSQKKKPVSKKEETTTTKTVEKELPNDNPENQK